MNKKLMIILFVLLFFSILATLTTGEIPWSEVWKGVQNRIVDGKEEWNPLLDERLPRLILLFFAGASLAVAGATMQAIFQNPIASPSVLGITSGGSLLVILVLASGLYYNSPIILPIAAFTGSFMTLFAVYSLSKTQNTHRVTSLILTGIAISTLLLAIQSLVLYLLRDQWQLIQTISEWEAAASTDRTWEHVHMQLPPAWIGLFICWSYRNELNLLSLGEEEAQNLGLDVARVRWHLFIAVALLAGSALAGLGVIPFFGLVLPHILRKVIGPNNIRVVPLCLFSGGTVLVMMDALLRISGWHFLSLGNLCGILGGLFFLFILMTQHQKEGSKLYARS